MKELKEIKKDLIEIRHYYSHIRNNCVGDKVGAESNLVQLTTIYNNAIKDAPAILYELYCALYIEGFTMEALADKWCYCYTTIFKRNKKLLVYLQSKIQ